MAKRVTLQIEDVASGACERYEFESPLGYVVPLVFRAAGAAVAAHPDEVASLAAAAKLLTDAAAACAGAGVEVKP